METQFQYIINLAKQYQLYADDSNTLFKALNTLEVPEIENVYKEYEEQGYKFQSVNLLRATVARLLLNGETITGDTIEKIKDHIRNKDLKYFSYLPEKYKQQLVNYPMGTKDIFSSWQEHWRVLQPFFYRGTIRETVRLYLGQLSQQLLKDLKIDEYTYVNFDFFGPGNFGATHCWIALYPASKNSYKDAYQFFFNLKSTPEVGRMAGYSLKESLSNIYKNNINSYAAAVKNMKGLKNEILKLNRGIRSYYKYSPGKQAHKWEEFREREIIALNFSHLNTGSLNSYETLEELNSAVGFDNHNQSNETWNMWLFKNANVGDVVFISKGVNTCLAIGIITGPYHYEESPDNFNHIRKVRWITHEHYQYKSGSLKGYNNIFRPDTFSPTKVWEFLLSEYARTYPALAATFEKEELQYSPGKVETSTVSNNETQDDEESVSYWWLNANPKIWSLSGCKTGEIQTYTTHNELGNKRRVYKYYETVKPGDIVIGYESTPTKQIKAILEITKGIFNQDGKEVIEFMITEMPEYPVNWNELKNNPALQNCEVFINNQGSLFSLREEEFEIIREVIDEKNIVAEKAIDNNDIVKYSFNNDKDKPFIKEENFRQIVSLLKRKKNIILQGPPGVGKTFIARKIAYEIMGETNDLSIEMVQFHQSYSYEDFVQGLRPTPNGSFELKDGIFYSFCQRATAHPDKDYFFIIDEINRGNLSKIFGELMMLIEADKRGQYLKLTYAEDEEERFSVPENLYIIGTMNTADRSLAIVDYALRRRFAFITLQPDYNENFKDFLLLQGLSPDLVNHIIKKVKIVNQEIRNDLNLGDGFQIGHSYFCTFNKEKDDENQWWQEILDFELKPLLEEIWFDNMFRVREMLKTLTSNN